MPHFEGLATGIGSMPHKDVNEALELILKYTPEIPFWPQLPQKDFREAMNIQYSEGFPCLEPNPQGIFFNSKEMDVHLERFYDKIINADVSSFKVSPDFAAGLWKLYDRLLRGNGKEIQYIKCQIVGPFTFAASINDDKGVALVHHDVCMQAIVKGLAMKAVWQVELFKKIGKRMIMFIDEPYLGSFGSAYTALNRDDVVRVLSELSGEIRSKGPLIGVHCCGNTDWSIFTDIDSIDIISFDAYGFLDKVLLYAEDLKKFFDRGGILCWGIVPTGDFSNEITAEALVDKVRSGIDTLVKKGVDKELLLESMILSPSCGMGTLDLPTTEKIMSTLAQVSQIIRK
ncbi:MAG: hypothetical protein WC486_06925 [Candidatus Omnitrophota bacterium]